VALAYDVEPWSDRHVELVGRSLELVGRIGSRVLYIPLIAQTQFGDSQSMVLWVKGADGKWNGPAFFALTMPETAFKEGVTVAEVGALVMTDKGLNSLLSGSSKLGTDVSVAAGPLGAAAPASVTADIVSYSHTKGAFGGFNLDGTDVALFAGQDAGKSKTLVGEYETLRSEVESLWQRLAEL
jgi:lipid-binding SYLF domain-containing protein